jgi:hypothetical protein
MISIAQSSPKPRRVHRIEPTLYRLCLLTAFLVLLGGFTSAEPPVQAAAKEVATRLTASMSTDAVMAMDTDAILNHLTPEERATFATQHWRFAVNVPVVVSVMRDVQQAVAPFWLAERGFHKTPLEVRNESYRYEVWQKAFPAGPVELGINGFDRHRPHYLVSVGPQEAGAKLELSQFFPADQQVFEMRLGASIYHDWPELVLTRVPPELEGQRLLPTIRGRAREAHLVQAFRTTPFPASAVPDQVLLTWSGDPKTTQSIQWRASAAVSNGIVRYREKDAPEAAWREVTAESTALDDRLITNDPVVNHFTARLTGLTPGTAYTYTVGGSEESQRSAPAEFRTEPAETQPFTFVFLSDTHNSPVTGDLLAAAVSRYPDTAFATISGDLVGIGQYRDDWDKLLAHAAAFTARYPLMPCVGNHDAIDGLGADLYVNLFDLPRNGPATLQPECAYSFEYGGVLFVLPDVTLSVEEQAPWLDQVLRDSTSAWKFAIFHFPPYAPDDETPEILEHWVPVLERRQVDFVLSGHVHHYLRSVPMRQGAPVESDAPGVTYMITVSTPGGPEPVSKPDYAAAFDSSGTPLYVAFTVTPRLITLEARDKEGKLFDEWSVDKKR